MALHPVQCRCRITQFALAVVEDTLRASDATEIEPQCGEATTDKILVHGINNLVVHGATVLRMGVKD